MGVGGLDNHEADPVHGDWLLIMLQTLWKSPHIRECIRTNPHQHHSGQSWWYTSMILTPERQRQENGDFKISQCYSIAKKKLPPNDLERRDT